MFLRNMGTVYINDNITREIKNLYKNSDSRIILLDYDGTLIPFSKYPSQANINDKAKKLIIELVNDKKNQIVIISGRDTVFLEEQFKNIEVILIAEHGYFIKKPGLKWKNLISIDFGWKQKVTIIFKKYVERYNGSFIEEKYASLAWHYRNVDGKKTELWANELKEELKEILKNNSKLQILEGNKVLEIKSIAYNKGSMASRLLSELKCQFIMAIGDDKTDEDVFSAMPENAYTIKVGTSSSIAKFYLKQQEHLYILFKSLLSS